VTTGEKVLVSCFIIAIKMRMRGSPMWCANAQSYAAPGSA
jgi:hypothetical protein